MFYFYVLGGHAVCAEGAGQQREPSEEAGGGGGQQDGSAGLATDHC